MSYEGYSQFLCSKGHLWTLDCNSVVGNTEENICRCGLPAVWENVVDVTNGAFDLGERIDGYVELEEASRQECDKCHSVLDVTYKIPKRKP